MNFLKQYDVCVEVPLKMKLILSQMNNTEVCFEHELSDILILLLNPHSHCNIFSTYTQLQHIAHQTFTSVP
jgi:hypothetical protein